MAFLGIRLPEALVADLPLLPLMSRYPELKWTKLPDLHLTLRFFPEGGTPNLETLVAAMQTHRTHVAPFDLHVRGAGTFDRQKNGGVLWLALASVPPQLSQLQLELESLAHSLGYAPEPRTFNPHITIARYRFEDREKVLEVVARITASPAFHRGFHADRFSLMKRTRDEPTRVYQDLLIRPLWEAKDN